MLYATQHSIDNAATLIVDSLKAHPNDCVTTEIDGRATTKQLRFIAKRVREVYAVDALLAYKQSPDSIMLVSVAPTVQTPTRLFN